MYVQMFRSLARLTQRGSKRKPTANWIGNKAITGKQFVQAIEDLKTALPTGERDHLGVTGRLITNPRDPKSTHTQIEYDPNWDGAPPGPRAEEILADIQAQTKKIDSYPELKIKGISTTRFVSSHFDLIRW